MMTKIWSGRSREFMKCLKRLRDEGFISFERQHDPLDKVRFRNSVADCLCEAESMFRPCGIKAVDKLIGELKSPLFRTAV